MADVATAAAAAAAAAAVGGWMVAWLLRRISMHRNRIGPFEESSSSPAKREMSGWFGERAASRP